VKTQPRWLYLKKSSAASARNEAPMEMQRIPHNALVLVGDGRRALFLRNVGTAVKPKLALQQLLHHETAPTRDIGTDRPGRAVPGPGLAKSAMEETDWHRLEENRFVHSVLEALSREALNEPGIHIVVVMPPKALGEFRAGMDKTLRKRIMAEIPQDLTTRPIDEIEKHLAVPPGAEIFVIR
jgi:protein required for attachment to host cells